MANQGILLFHSISDGGMKMKLPLNIELHHPELGLAFLAYLHEVTPEFMPAIAWVGSALVAILWSAKISPS